MLLGRLPLSPDINHQLSRPLATSLIKLRRRRPYPAGWAFACMGGKTRDTTMPDIIQLVPNDWVTEQVLIITTGLKSGTINRARKVSWFAGQEYLQISPDGSPKANSECMYNIKAINRWIESQSHKQPDEQRP
jgi:hypothetical protein